MKVKTLPREIEQGAYMDSPINSRWEVDTDAYIEQIYNRLLGNVIDGGIWARDENRPRIMNELGASEYTQSFYNLCSKHTHFSDLSDNEIVNISSMEAEIFAEKLRDNYHLWEITSEKSSYMSIAYRLFRSLQIFLKIARNGGYKTHRERSNNPYMHIPQQTEEQPII